MTQHCTQSPVDSVTQPSEWKIWNLEVELEKNVKDNTAIHELISHLHNPLIVDSYFLSRGVQQSN